MTEFSGAAASILFVILLLNGTLARLAAGLASFAATVLLIGGTRLIRRAWGRRAGLGAVLALAVATALVAPGAVSAQEAGITAAPPIASEGGGPICTTCAVFNVFNAYFDTFAKEAFLIIGNGVTVLAFGFAAALGLLRYAMLKAMPAAASDKPIIDLPMLVTFLIGLAALKAADKVVWRTYEAVRDWAMDIATQLIAAGAGGVFAVPAQATTDAARLVGSAESVVWAFVDFAFEMLSGPSFWGMLAGDDGISTMVSTVVFSLLLLAVYGGLLLYFAFIILRSLIYLVMPVAFGTLILGAACFPQTRQVLWSAIRLIANAFLTIIGAGVAMGMTARVLSLSKNVVKCYVDSRDAGSCGAEISSLAHTLGVPAGRLVEAFNSFEIFSVLTVLGACCWIVHYCVSAVVAQITQSQNDAGPLALFAAATTGAIYAGGRAAYGATSLSMKATGAGIQVGNRVARSLYQRSE